MSIFSWHQNDFEQLAARVGELPHALLIRGPVGIGKRVFARAIAQGLLCEQPVAPMRACGQCQACHWFANDAHPDFRCLQPEGAVAGDSDEPVEKKKKQDISIAQVRALGEFINVSAHRNGSKIVLIAPAEAMNVNAANALLKSLEEPPPRTQFLLVSDRPNILPATIRSRCQQLLLRSPSMDEATDWLRLSGSTHPELALAQAGGAPVSAAELDTEDYWTARQQFLEGLCSKSFDPLALAERFAGHAVPQIVGWLQRWTYDLGMASCRQHVRYNPDRQDVIHAAARRLPPLVVLRFHRELVRMQRVVHHPLNARLLLEDLFLRYAQLIRGGQGAG